MDNTQSIQQIEHVCKNCGAQLEQTDSDTLKCSYCGTEITLVAISPVNEISNNHKTIESDYSQYDKTRENRRIAQQHNPSHGQPDISFKTRPYSIEEQNKTYNQSENKTESGVAVDAFFKGIKWGFILWFAVFICKGLMEKFYGPKFDLFSTANNSILMSPYFGLWWWIRGLVIVFSSAFICTYIKLRAHKGEQNALGNRLSESQGIIKPTNVVGVGIKGGLILWFIYYVVRACYDHTNFALSSTYYNNIFISPIFKGLWLLRGIILIGICIALCFIKPKNRTQQK